MKEESRGAVERRIIDSELGYDRDYLEWFLSWKPKSYNTYDKMKRPVRVKVLLTHIGLKVTQWNWDCYKTTYAKHVDRSWEVVEEKVPIRDITPLGKDYIADDQNGFVRRRSCIQRDDSATFI